MKERRWLPVLMVLASLSLGATCATRPPGPAPELVTGESDRIAGWVRDFRAEGETRRSVRAYARVRIETPQGRGRFREVIAVQRPDQLRIETLNFLGQTQSLLLADAGGAMLFDGSSIERQGDAESLLARLGLELSPREAISVLLAAPPLRDPAQARILAEGDERVVEQPEQRLRFASDGTLRRVESLEPGGAPIWLAEFDDWQALPAGRFPMKIVLSFPRTGFRAALDLESAELNVALDASLFRTPETVE